MWGLLQSLEYLFTCQHLSPTHVGGYSRPHTTYRFGKYFLPRMWGLLQLPQYLTQSTNPFSHACGGYSNEWCTQSEYYIFLPRMWEKSSTNFSHKKEVQFLISALITLKGEIMFISYVRFKNPSFDEGDIHSQLYASFPADMGRILYKKEKTLNNDHIEFYALVYSEKKPFSTQDILVIQTTEVDVRFQENNLLNFEIKLSPEISHDGKRIPQKLAFKRIEYVQKKLLDAGLSPIGDVREISSEVLKVSHKTGGYTIRAYIYKGRVIVDDAEKLKSAYEKGIGHHKAYGCGMLCLKR